MREARAKELKYLVDKGVWIKRPKNEARQKTGKGAISVRWVDVNKGDDLCPRYRSRPAAGQLKAHDRSGASFFAPTPPLEALSAVLSLAAATVVGWRPCYVPKSEQRIRISLMGLPRAHFNLSWTQQSSPTSSSQGGPGLQEQMWLSSLTYVR